MRHRVGRKAPVQVRDYDLEHLRPGDIVTSSVSTYQVTTAPAGFAVLAHDLLEPSQPDELLLMRQLGTSPHILPGPGRTSGLRSAFWNAPETLASAEHPTPGRPLTPYDGAQLALTCGGGLHLRHTELPDGALTLSLAVPGCELHYGTSTAAARSHWWGLDRQLEIAAQLDRGLSAAGTMLAYCAKQPGVHLATLWTATLAAHLGLAPYPAAAQSGLTPAHRVVAELGPTWTRPTDQLATILAALGPPAGA